MAVMCSLDLVLSDDTAGRVLDKLEPVSIFDGGRERENSTGHE